MHYKEFIVEVKPAKEYIVCNMTITKSSAALEITQSKCGIDIH